MKTERHYPSDKTKDMEKFLGTPRVLGSDKDFQELEKRHLGSL